MSEKKRWKFIHFLGYAIPILLVVYVLSIGPIQAYVWDTYPNVDSDRLRYFEDFYAPLRWCLERSPSFEKIIVEYISIFSEKY